MENLPIKLRRNKSTFVTIEANTQITFALAGGIDYSEDFFELRYKGKKYANLPVKFTYNDANGFIVSYIKIIPSGGYFSWRNEYSIENSNFGLLSLSCTEYVEFLFRVYRNHFQK